MLANRGLKSILLLIIATTLVLTSCGAPTPIVEEKEVEVTKIEEVTKEVTKIVQGTPIIETILITATPEPVIEPTPLPELGMDLIGRIEGPTLITDPAQWPTVFNEAPMLSILVEAGKLPPVAERLPKEPLVLEPLDEIGTYGGTWHKGFVGVADFENISRSMSSEKFIFSNPEGTEPRPSLAKGWELSEDGTEFTIYLREGARWSDGEPFTTVDVQFWYEDIYSNSDLTPAPNPQLSVGGEPAELVIIDDYTFKWVYPAPNFLVEEQIFGDTPLAGANTRWASFGLYYTTYAPAHYLKQFLPKYSSEEELNQIALDEGYDGWTSYFKFKFNYGLNPELPMMTPWITKTPINNPTWVLERNPYYWATDTAGNQLPYIDEIILTLAEDLEVLNLRAVAGEYDFQTRHIALDKLPVFLENREVGNYWVSLNVDPCSAPTVAFNFTYPDETITQWMLNVDFRRALSIGIDRDQINEAFFLGIGTPGSVVIEDGDPTNPGPEYRTLWSTYEPEQANLLLDSIGLDQKDDEGYRLLPNGERLTLVVDSLSAAFIPFADILEMIIEQWKEIGIYAEANVIERSLFSVRYASNEDMMSIRLGTACSAPWQTPYNMIPHTEESNAGSPWYQWWATDGQEGEEPSIPHVVEAIELYKTGPSLNVEERVEVVQQIWKWAVDEVWFIGVIGQSPSDHGVNIVSNCMVNVPERFSKIRSARVPGGGHPETWFFSCP